MEKKHPHAPLAEAPHGSSGDNIECAEVRASSINHPTIDSAPNQFDSDFDIATVLTLDQRGVMPHQVERTTSSRPGRLQARPDRDCWGLDDLLTLPEAAALYWPDGPVTVATLRTSIRRGQLRIARLGRRFMTSRRALEEMQRDEVRFLINDGDG